jgi:hypothetical protein
MGRYLLLWEADETKIPLDPKVRQESWLAACEMVKQDFKSGIIKDWGVFLGQAKGFAIDEGTEEEIQKLILQYIPYFRFKVIPIRTIDQHIEALKNIK